jgi:hypothetical protein
VEAWRTELVEREKKEGMRIFNSIQKHCIILVTLSPHDHNVELHLCTVAKTQRPKAFILSTESILHIYLMHSLLTKY